MKVDDVLQCSLPTWYPQFEKVTIYSVCLPLPGAVTEYLCDNVSLVLPRECNKESYDGTEDDYDDFGDTNWEDQNEQGESEQKSFPEFSKENWQN